MEKLQHSKFVCKFLQDVKSKLSFSAGLLLHCLHCQAPDFAPWPSVPSLAHSPNIGSGTKPTVLGCMNMTWEDAVFSSLTTPALYPHFILKQKSAVTNQKPHLYLHCSLVLGFYPSVLPDMHIYFFCKHRYSFYSCFTNREIEAWRG